MKFAKVGIPVAAIIIVIYYVISHKTPDYFPPPEVNRSNTQSKKTSSTNAVNEAAPKEKKEEAVPLLTAKESRKQCKTLIYLVNSKGIENPEKELFNFIELSSHKPSTARAHWELGAFYEKRGSYDSAIEHYLAALKLGALTKAQEFKVRLRLLQTYSMNFEEEQAAAILKNIEELYLAERAPMYEAPKTFPPPDKTHRLLAEALWRAGLLEEGLRYATLAAGAQNRQQQRATLVGARILAAQGKSDEAIEFLTKAVVGENLVDTKFTSKAYLEMVEIALRFDDPHMALDLADKAAERFADKKFYKSFIYQVGETFRKHGDAGWHKFMEEIAFSESGGMRSGALESLISTAKKEMRWEDVEDYYQTLLTVEERSGPKIVEDYIGLLGALVKQDKEITPLMDGLLDFAEKAGESDVASLYRLGKKVFAAGELESAMTFFERVVQLGGNNEWALNSYAQLAKIYTELNDANESAKNYLYYIDENSRQKEHLKTVHGIVKLLNSDSFSAVATPRAQSLNQLLYDSIDSIEDPIELDKLVVFLHNQKQRDAIQYTLNRFIQISPSYSAVEDAVAYENFETTVLKRMHEFALYEELLNRSEGVIGAIKNRTSPNGLRIRYYNASSLWRAGDRAEAKSRFEDILEDSKNNKAVFGEISMVIGMHYYAGRDQKYAEIFDETISRAPNSKGANVARVFLSAKAIEEGNLDQASELNQLALTKTNPAAGVEWERGVYWNSVYLKGLIMTKSGQPDGEALKKEAQSNTKIYSNLLKIN